MLYVEGKRYTITRDACDWLCGHWEVGQPRQPKLVSLEVGGGDNMTSVGGAESGHAAARERKAVASGSQILVGQGCLLVFNHDG